MKKKNRKLFSFVLTASIFMSGCSSNEEKPSQTTPENSFSQTENRQETNATFVPELEVRFGREGTPFTLHLYDNDTARAISR